MQIQITDTLKTKHGIYVDLECGKFSATVCISSPGVQVICKNAAHRVWRGAGKRFNTIEEALDGYRSGEMKAMIGAAAEFAQAA